MRCRAVAREMLATLAVNLVWGLVLLLPVLYTGLRIRERQALLDRTVGTLHQEDAAHHTATSLMVALPVCLVIAFLAQVGLFLLYNYRLHAWQEIVHEERIADIFTSHIDTSQRHGRAKQLGASVKKTICEICDVNLN